MLALCAGWGSLLSLCSGSRLRGTLLLPAGFAAVVVVSGLVTEVSAFARMATPVVVGGAVAGLAAAWPWPRPPRTAAWPAAAALLVFAEYAAPIVMSG